MSASTASTNGWDTASAIPMGYANLAIKQQKASPTSFSGSYSDFGTKYQVKGDFGDWALWGGTGTDVNMNIPFTGGSINPAPPSLSGKFGSGEVVVTVKLGFVPQPSDDMDLGVGGRLRFGGWLRFCVRKLKRVLGVYKLSADSGHEQISNKQDLVTKTTTTDPTNAPVVVLDSITFASATDQKNYEIAVGQGLLKYLNGNLQDFNHVFSVADINVQADKGSFQWLKPTSVAYAVEGPKDATPTPTTIDQWVFGVLAMTENRTPPAASQVSINAIPKQPGVNGGFLISQERFIRKLFMPGIEKQFVGAKDTDFDTTNDGATITNVSELQLSPLEVPDADPQPVTDAKIGTGSFQINALNQHIELVIGMSFTWRTGYVCTLQYTGTTYLTSKTVSYKDPKTGKTVTKNVLQMPESGKPTMHYIVTKTTAERWSELIESIVISVAGAIVGGLLGGALGGAAEGAEAAAVDGATDAAGTAAGDALEGTMTGIDDAAADNAPELADEALGDASEGLDNPSKLQKFGSFLRASWKKILGSILGGVAGTLASQIPNILEAEKEKDLANIPSLDNFATEAVSPNTWANTKSFSMVSLQLNESMQFGLKFVPKA